MHQNGREADQEKTTQRLVLRKKDKILRPHPNRARKMTWRLMMSHRSLGLLFSLLHRLLILAAKPCMMLSKQFGLHATSLRLATTSEAESSCLVRLSKVFV